MRTTSGTYPAAMAYVMEEAAARKIPILVLDRPNPIDGFDVEGPMQDAEEPDAVVRVDRHAGDPVGERAQTLRRQQRQADDHAGGPDDQQQR